MNSMTYSTYLPLTSCQYQLIDLILLWYFLRLLCHANPGVEKNEQDPAYIFQDTYSESC